MSPDTLRGNLAAFLSTILWASAFPVTQHLLETWDPLPLAAARLGLASAAMLVMAFMSRQLPAARALPWRDICLLGGLGVAVSVLCLLAGQALSDPVTASAIATMQPVAALLIGYASGRERLRPLQIMGILLAVSGALVVSPASQGAAFRGGEPLLVANVLLWTWYSHGARERLGGLGTFAVGGLTMAVASAVLVAGSIAVSPIHPQAVDLSLDSLPWLFWMGVVGIGLSVPLWLSSVRLLGLAIASLHINLAPFYVILIGLLFGGSLSARQIFGAGLVATGAIVAQRFRQVR
ncbi:MAG TPA: DMT family transporter [Geminicoccaceae bacterium]|nr:DMT family transporter [Geminicoccus sp.]HMU48353.1 DMT family transporter [Geminicoccaceae bacterium]